MTRPLDHPTDLYGKLEAEVRLVTRFRKTASIAVALTEHRKEEIPCSANLSHVYCVAIEEPSPAEVRARNPSSNTEGVVAGVHLPSNWQTDPGSIALPLADDENNLNAVIAEKIKVSAAHKKPSYATGLSWLNCVDQGHIAASMVVNCADLLARGLGAKTRVNVPLRACEQFYIAAEGVGDMGRQPSQRVPGECVYSKQDIGKTIPDALDLRGMARIPESLEVDQLHEGFNHFAPILSATCNRMPILAKARPPHGLRLCSLHARDSCRLEKTLRQFRHYVICREHAPRWAVGLGYVPCTEFGEKPAKMLAKSYQIEIAGRHDSAEASLPPIQDPKSDHVDG